MNNLTENQTKGINSEVIAIFKLGGNVFLFKDNQKINYCYALLNEEVIKVLEKFSKKIINYISVQNKRTEIID